MVEISNASDFAAVLDGTIAEIDALVVTEPDYPVWRALQQQLHAMKAWSTSETRPTQGQLGSVSIGLIAARELEPAPEGWLQDLIDRLHLLNHYWRHWPGGPPAPARGERLRAGGASRTGRNVIAIGLPIAAVVLVLLLGLALFLDSLTLTKPGPWTRSGTPMRAGDALASLETSQEPYAVQLNRNPEGDRYAVRLKIADPASGKPDQLIPLAAHMRAGELGFDAKLLGDDGRQLWFYVNGIQAWDYRKGRLTTGDDLRRANPGLGLYSSKDNSADPLIAGPARNYRSPPRDIWSGEPRLYSFDKRLRIATPDFSRDFVVDPVTLRAEEVSGRDQVEPHP